MTHTPPTNATERFTGRERDYASARPSYPAEAIDAVLVGLSDPGHLLVADVGAGTGISSRLVADRGCRVLAIEPNAAMRSAATPHPRVEFREGTAEATGLEPETVDVVLCAQAFHWFRVDEALAEFARVLKSSGRLALVWNDRDRADPFSEGYYRIVLSTPEGERVSKSWATDHPLAGRAGWTGLRESRAWIEQVFDLDGLLGRARSASYVPDSGLEHDRIMRELGEHHARFADGDGRVTMRYETRVFTAAPARGFSGRNGDGGWS